MVTFRHEITHHERIPFLYGIAYYRFVDQKFVCYPVPFHAAIGLLRLIYNWFRFWPGKLGRGEHMAIYVRGVEDGVKVNEITFESRVEFEVEKRIEKIYERIQKNGNHQS